MSSSGMKRSLIDRVFSTLDQYCVNPFLQPTEGRPFPQNGTISRHVDTSKPVRERVNV